MTATAFERAYRKRARFDPDPRRAASLALRHRPQRRARRAAPARAARRSWPPSRLDEALSPATRPLEQRERRLTVGAALAGLDGAERELVALKFFAGLTNAEIAAVVGVSESNAGTRLHRVGRQAEGGMR